MKTCGARLKVRRATSISHEDTRNSIKLGYNYKLGGHEPSKTDVVRDVIV